VPKMPKIKETLRSISFFIKLAAYHNFDMAAKRHKKHKNKTLKLIFSIGYEIKIREF
jgi:hypothetical protein